MSGLVGVSVVGVMVAALAGCAGAGGSTGETELVSTVAPASEAPTETVPVLSDEEALQIAVETYEEYLAISGELIDTQGANFDELEAITTANMASANRDSLEQAQSGDFHTEGHIPIIKSQLVQHERTFVDVLLCLDLSQSQTFDESGEALGPDRTGLTNAIDVRVVFDDGLHKLDRSDLWTQSDFCSV